ncbi:hypothetical protein Tco_0281332 [Tanacetum coccineum]
MDVDGATDALGIRCAPPDPNLPEPWKGLMDGRWKRAYVMPLGYHLFYKALKSRWLRMSVLLRKWNVKLQVGRRKPRVGVSLEETKECNSHYYRK